MRILIAEDDLTSRNCLNKYLSQYGECDLTVDGLETVDAFLIALKDEPPYELICLDIMMPKADGIRTLKAIRNLEKQCGVAPERRAKVVMTTALADVELVRAAFEHGCQAYAVKPIDAQRMAEVLARLGLEGANSVLKHKNTAISGMHRQNSSPTMDAEGRPPRTGYFKSVQALPGHQLEVIMGTGTTIRFGFRSRLNTVRFGMLRDEELFRSVSTDGTYLNFLKPGRMPVRITASEFMDLVLIDRTKMSQ